MSRSCACRRYDGQEVERGSPRARDPCTNAALRLEIVPENVGEPVAGNRREEFPERGRAEFSDGNEPTGIEGVVFGFWGGSAGLRWVQVDQATHVEGPAVASQQAHCQPLATQDRPDVFVVLYVYPSDTDVARLHSRQVVDNDPHPGLLNDVDDLQVRPLLSEVLRNQAAVAVMRLLFAAEQATVGDLLPGDVVLDVTKLHQSQKIPLVGGPLALLFLVRVQYLRSRCENWQVDVVRCV